jgi:hypothetical protein
MVSRYGASQFLGNGRHGSGHFRRPGRRASPRRTPRAPNRSIVWILKREYSRLILLPISLALCIRENAIMVQSFDKLERLSMAAKRNRIEPCFWLQSYGSQNSESFEKGCRRPEAADSFSDLHDSSTLRAFQRKDFFLCGPECCLNASGIERMKRL